MNILLREEPGSETPWESDFVLNLWQGRFRASFVIPLVSLARFTEAIDACSFSLSVSSHTKAVSDTSTTFI